MEETQYTVTIKTASEGMFLTQKAEVLPDSESRLYATKITVNDNTKDNYREATVEEKEAYERSIEGTLM
jgi:hypothetical protein